MSGEISLSDELLLAISLPDSVAKEGGEHLAIRCFDGVKAEPVMDLQSGHLVGHEYLSLFPEGICADSFFRLQSATALTELFLLHLLLSQRLGSVRRFINLPVRVLLREKLCTVLCQHDLWGVVVEIQDVETLVNPGPSVRDSLYRNLHQLMRRGAEIYADDVPPDQIASLQSLCLPLSGIKISRDDFLRLLRERGPELPVREYHRLAPVTVIEGVETPEQYLIAAMSGASFGQGYLWPAVKNKFEQLRADNPVGNNRAADII